MKASKTMIAVLCTLVLAVAVPASAEDKASGDSQTANTALSLEEGLLGKSVNTQNGEEVGEVEDVIFSRQGKVSHVLVDVGGFLGIGEKTVALKLNQLQVDQDHALFKGTRSDLENMPEVDIYAFRRPYRGYYDPSYGPYSPYGPTRGYDPYYAPYGRGYMRDQAEPGYRDRQSGDFADDREMYQRQTPRREYYRDRDGRDRMDHGRAMQQDRMQGRMDSEISGQLFIGAPVFDHRNDHLGEIDDLVINPANGRISHAVIEAGGILGIGDKKFLVPFNHLRQMNPDYVMYRGTEEQLKRMPAYEQHEGGRVSGGALRRDQRAGGQGESHSGNRMNQGGSQ